MDADVALKDFTDVPYVIERPAEPDLLADAAVSMLAKSGLRLSFGQEARETVAHDLLVASVLPDGGVLLSRRGGQVQCAPGAAPATIMSGPARAAEEAGAPSPHAAMAFRTFEMTGQAIHGLDRPSSTTFAAFMSVTRGAPEGTLAHCAARMDANGLEGAALVRKADSLKEGMKANPEFMASRSERLAKAARSFSTRYARILAPARPAGEGFDGLVVKASLGPTGPERLTDGMTTLPRFTAKEFGSAPAGPAWLPPSFNERSQAEAQGIHPDLLKVVALAKSLTATDFEIVPRTGGMRSEKEQKHLKKAGRSQAKLGRHTIGQAVDLVPVGKRGRLDFGNMKGFDDIRDAMEAAAEKLDVPIQWGGAWKMVDKPHFELDRKVYPGPGEEPDVEAVVTAFR